MCGRFTQTTGELPGLETVVGPDSDGHDQAPRYNGAPSQAFWTIRRNPQSGAYQRDLMAWGFVPPGRAATGRPGPINARSETVASLELFAGSYAKRRCLVPIDGFFEWKEVTGAKSKRPYAIAMKTREPFALAGIWTAYKGAEGAVVRSFAVVTTSANPLLADIHHRMPVVIAPKDYDRWLGIEPDPRDLMIPYPPEAMQFWPVSTKVNAPRNDDPSILDPVDEVVS